MSVQRRKQPAADGESVSAPKPVQLRIQRREERVGRSSITLLRVRREGG